MKPEAEFIPIHLHIPEKYKINNTNLYVKKEIEVQLVIFRVFADGMILNGTCFG